MNFPFKFLDSYTKEDKDIFFGRETEVEELYQKVFESKILLVCGVSGTGKSSLIDCGLANKFEDSDWLPVSVRRGRNILDSLERELGKVSISEVRSEKRRGGEEEKGRIIKTLQSIYLDHFKPIYLIFDQFEELFIFGDREEREEFIKIVKTIVDSDVQCKLLFVMREEYLAGAIEFEKAIPTFLTNRLRIEKMTRTNAKQVIEEPCKVHGIKVEEGLAETILGKLSPESTEVELTYLQVLLDKLYHLSVEKNKEKPGFTGDLLQEIGDVSDLLGSFLEDQIIQLEDPETGLTILKSFVSIKGTKRQVTLEDISEFATTLGKKISEEELKNLILKFVNLRILTGKDESGRYELRHDSLATKIYEKITLVEKELLEVRQFLENAYSQFEKRKTYLTTEDLKYIAPYEDKLFLNKRLEKLIEDSKKEAQKAKRRKRNVVIIAAVSLIIILAGYTIWALIERNHAIESKKESKSNMYASYAFNLIESNSTMSYRLAEEALKTDKNNKAAYRAILNSYYSGAFYSVIAEFDNELNCLKISPDNNHIITVPFRSDNIQIWDTTGNMINDFISNEGSTREIEFLPDSLMFFTCPSTSIFDFHGNLIKQYPGHGNTDLLSVSRGNLIASFSNEYIELWNVEGKEIMKIPVEKYVTNIALSPDNSYLSYTFLGDPVIRLINLKNNKKTKLFGHKDNLKHMNYEDIVTSLNFSQDSKLLLSSCLDSTCILWNIEGKPLLTLKSLETPATFAAISPNIEKIAIAGYGGKVDIYSISGIIQKSFNTNQYWIDDIRFSNDDKIYTTCTDCSEILLWDISEKKSETIKSHSKRINNIDYSPDGKHFVTASFDSTAILYNAKGGVLQHLTGHKGKINSAQFAGNSKLIVTASNDHYVIVWDLKGEKLLQYQFDKYPVEFASFSPDNKHIILISPANIVRIIDLDGRIISDFQWLYDYSWNVGGSWWPRSTLLDTLGREINYKEWHNSFVNSAELSPDSKYVLTASNDSTARLWDTQGKEILRFNGHNDRVIDASFSGSGERIVTIGLDNSIRLWDINGDLLEVFGGCNETPRYAIFSYDDGYIITQSLDDTTRWYDMDGNMLEKDFWNRECYISSSFFSPSGKQILTASRDGTANLWNLNSKQNIELGESYYASFSPCDEYIATINWNEITIWDYFGNKINSFVASEDMVNTVEFSADGNFLLSCSKDNTAILWDLKGNEIQSFTGNGNEVTSASFSPDGKYIIMTTDAKTIQKWLIDPDEIADIINKKTLSGHVWEMTAEAKIKYNVDLNHYEKGLEKAKNLKHDAHSTMDSIKKVDYLFEAIDEYEYIINTAKDILQQNEFLKVKKLCSDLYLELSIISIKTNDLIKALEYSEKGLTLQPSHRELPVYRAIALILNDRYNEAQKILKNLKGKPVKTGNEIYNEYILNIINSLEKENISHSDFLKVRTFLSNYFLACNNRSLALLYDGKFKEALFYAKKGYEIDSTEIIIYTKLALAYLLNEEYEKAEVIILKHRDEIVNNILFKDYILEKLKELESKGITHLDFEKVRALLEK